MSAHRHLGPRTARTCIPTETVGTSVQIRTTGIKPSPCPSPRSSGEGTRFDRICYFRVRCLLSGQQTLTLPFTPLRYVSRLAPRVPGLRERERRPAGRATFMFAACCQQDASGPGPGTNVPHTSFPLRPGGETGGRQKGDEGRKLRLDLFGCGRRAPCASVTSEYKMSQWA